MTAARDLLKLDDLAEWTGYDHKQVARIRKWLDENGISYRIGKDGRPCTTLQAVNDAIVKGDRDVDFA